MSVLKSLLATQQYYSGHAKSILLKLHCSCSRTEIYAPRSELGKVFKVSVMRHLAEARKGGVDALLSSQGRRLDSTQYDLLPREACNIYGVISEGQTQKRTRPAK